MDRTRSLINRDLMSFRIMSGTRKKGMRTGRFDFFNEFDLIRWQYWAKQEMFLPFLGDPQLFIMPCSCGFHSSNLSPNYLKNIRHPTSSIVRPFITNTGLRIWCGYILKTVSTNSASCSFRCSSSLPYNRLFVSGMDKGALKIEMWGREQLPIQASTSLIRSILI